MQIRLFSSDRFVLRRVSRVGTEATYNLFDKKLCRNVRDGKGADILATQDDIISIRNEMTARVALLKCDENTRKLAFS